MSDQNEMDYLIWLATPRWKRYGLVALRLVVLMPIIVYVAIRNTVRSIRNH